jgi:hypothetical protein
VDADTVMKLASDGELPPMTMQGETRFLRKDVLTLLRDKRNARPRFEKPRRRVR